MAAVMLCGCVRMDMYVLYTKWVCTCAFWMFIFVPNREIDMIY